MNDHELAAFVRSLSYNRGRCSRCGHQDEDWRFDGPGTYDVFGGPQAYNGPMQGVQVSARLQDAAGTRNVSTVFGTAVFPRHADVHAVAISIYDAIQQIDQHEIMEWFQSNGVSVFNPHPNGGTAIRPHRPGEVLM